MNDEIFEIINPRIPERIKTVWDNYDVKRDNDVLYHYTTSDGLIGIINSKSLWATCIDFLNDPNELTYGINLCHQIVESLDSISESLKLALGVYFEIYSENRKDKYLTSDLYIISFCEHHETLGQWRLYGKNGEGYCVGINLNENIILIPEYDIAEEFDEIVLTSCAHPKKVIYDSKQQHDLITGIILSVDSELSTIFENKKIIPSSNESFSIYSQTARFIIENILPFIKKPEFYDESEWRILIKFEKNISRKFRTNNNVIIPYTILKFYERTGKEASQISVPIKDIIIGQALNFQRAHQGLRYFLKSYNHDEISISRSLIEFQ